MAALDTLPFGRETWRTERCLLEAFRVFGPCHLVDARHSGLLQTEEARPQNIDAEMMQERRQFILSVPGDGFSYCGPAPVTQLPGSASGPCFAVRAFSLAPAPSLHELRRSRGRFAPLASLLLQAVRLLASRSSSATASGLPDTIPATTRCATAMEISRFPGRRLLRMPALRRRGLARVLR